MPKIIQLSPHIANLIAAGEVVERPASVAKELLENAVDAGASKITLEIRNGGMTFLRVTDNGCGMSSDDAKTAFLRHATSKLRTAEDLAAISTMGFRGEALAAIASVSRIDLLTKMPGSIAGAALTLEAGVITEDSEAGCPDGTTIIVRDLFYNTPARMKFMKSDAYEGSRVASAVQMQALAHPEVSFTFIRDGKQVLQTPGNGDLQAAAYCIYGKELGQMVKVESRWEACSLTGFVSKPTDARPSRAMQTFFVNGRPVKSKLMVAALEEAYRNQIMVGKFPACVLHLYLPVTALDVNVHPAKTEVKFLREKEVFDCVHYGVLGALNQTADRPQVQFKPAQSVQKPISAPVPSVTPVKSEPKPFFRTMSAEEFKQFSAVMQEAPRPRETEAKATAQRIEQQGVLHEQILLPVTETVKDAPPVERIVITPPPAQPEPEQTALEMPVEIPWRMVGELYRSYVLVEQGEEAFLIDKHAAHERILFDKLKANQERISSQMLLTPVTVRLNPEAAAEVLANLPLMEELGFELEEFGENALLLRQIPMDLDPQQAAETVETMAADLISGRKERRDTVRDEVLHTVACKAAIKAGWRTDEKELLALCKTVMEREDLKYCPHGRPICITLSKKQLEKQFKRS